MKVDLLNVIESPFKHKILSGTNDCCNLFVLVQVCEKWFSTWNPLVTGTWSMLCVADQFLCQLHLLFAQTFSCPLLDFDFPVVCMFKRPHNVHLSLSFKPLTCTEAPSKLPIISLPTTPHKPQAYIYHFKVCASVSECAFVRGETSNNVRHRYLKIHFIN